MKNLTLFICLSILPFFLFSQDTLEVQGADEPPVSPEVIANLFPGQGVQIIDWTFVGSDSAAGVFSGGMDAVDIDHGIMLSTGMATLAAEANNSSGNGNNINQPGDTDMDSLSGAMTFDAAVLTVVFKPISDTMHFNYAFASDEYPEYVGSNFNDAFGFFVSGPGINGPYTNNAVNIALIPGTSVPVSINTVNDTTFGQFYNDNHGSGIPPVYDGIIDVFSATLPVVPLETYTLKIAIADAGDGIFDSAVFLEAESFVSGNDSLVTNVSDVFYNPCLEGEAPRPLTFDLSGFGSWTFPFTSTVSGTAERGVDFEITGLPETIEEAGAMMELELEVFADSETEGVEYFRIEFESQGGFTFPYYFYINDGIASPLTDLAFCDAPQTLVLSAEGPLPGEVYEFSNDGPQVLPPANEILYSEIEVSGVPVNTLTDVSLIESVCVDIDHDWLSDLDLFLIAPDGQLLKLSTDNGGSCDDYSNTCFSPAANEKINVALASATPCPPNGQAPSTGTFLPEADWDEIDGTPVNGTWKLAITDDSEGFSGTLQNWSISFNTGIIFDQPVFEWSTGETTPDITVSPTATTTYSVTVSQSGNQIVAESTVFFDGDNSISEITGTHCENEQFSLTVNGTVYDIDHPTGTEVLAGANYLGCDSTVNIDLVFLKNAFAETTVETCSGDCLEIGGQSLCESGVYEITLTNFQGCDSILTVDFTKVETQAEIAPPGQLDPLQPSTLTLDGSGSSATPVPGGLLGYEWTGPGITGPANEATATIDQPGTYCLTLVFSKNNLSCESTSCVEVGLAPLPAPNPPILTGPATTCNGPATYTATDPDGMAVDFNWTTPNGEPFTVIFPNSVEVDWTGSAGGPLCVSSSNATGTSQPTCLEVEILAPVGIVNLTASCDSQAENYTVFFEILGGDPATYTVAPAGSGTLSGNVFTSNPIPSGEGYSFTVSDDSGCGETIAEGVIVCACLTYAGEMDSTPIEVCGAGTVFANLTLGENLDGNDVLAYMLHNGNDQPIAISDEPVFDLDGMAPGNYFISAVAGNDDGSGSVDFTDNCLDISEGTPVIFHEMPTAEILTPGTSLCSGELFDIEIAFTGEGPWSLTGDINGSFFEMDGITENPVLLHYTLTENFTLTLDFVFDAFCASELEEIVSVEVLPSPEVEITVDSPVCPNSQDAVQIGFLGEAPYFIAYELNGILFFDSVPGNLFELGIPIIEDSEFTLLSTLGANGCSLGSQPTVNVDIVPDAAAEASFNGPLCPGFDLVLSAEGGAEYVWSGPGGFESGEQEAIVENITGDQLGQYLLTAQNGCGDEDMTSVEVSFDCLLFTDTVPVGGTGEICFDEIISSADLCDPVSAISVEVDGNCLSFTGLSEGSGTVCLQVVFDGQETAAQVVVTSLTGTPTAERDGLSWLNVYPNPASETVMVSWEKMEVEQAELLDLRGRHLSIFPSAISPLELPLGHLPEGTYLLRFQTSEGVLTRKVVVMR